MFRAGKGQRRRIHVEQVSLVLIRRRDFHQYVLSYTSLKKKSSSRFQWHNLPIQKTDLN